MVGAGFDVERGVDGVEFFRDEDLRFVSFEDAEIFPGPPHVYPWRLVELEDCKTEAQREIHSFLARDVGPMVWGEVLVERDEARKVGGVAV